MGLLELLHVRAICLALSCARHGCRCVMHGWLASPQVLTNIPFTAIHFSTYEAAKKLLTAGGEEGVVQQLVAGV
jgi:hypothetical protein